MPILTPEPSELEVRALCLQLAVQTNDPPCATLDLATLYYDFILGKSKTAAPVLKIHKGKE